MIWQIDTHLINVLCMWLWCYYGSFRSLWKPTPRHVCEGFSKSDELRWEGTLSGWHYSGGWGPGLGKKGWERWAKHSPLCFLAVEVMWTPVHAPATVSSSQGRAHPDCEHCIAFVNSLSQHQEKELIQSLAYVTARCGWGGWPWSSRTAHFPRMDTGINTHVFNFLLCLLHGMSRYSVNPTRTGTSVCFTLCY